MKKLIMLATAISFVGATAFIVPAKKVMNQAHATAQLKDTIPGQDTSIMPTDTGIHSSSDTMSNPSVIHPQPNPPHNEPATPPTTTPATPPNPNPPAKQ